MLPAFVAQAGVGLTTLYSFHVFPDGANPNAGLVQGSDGNFYGTTTVGGTNGGYGTIFKISTNGAVTSLYSFTGGYDGAYPYAGLVQGSDGNLYGTTEGGGTNSDGTVFEISTNGALTTLHSFTGNDGEDPEGRLVQGTDGGFYGTTSAGTVFRINANGSFTNLYSFYVGNVGSGLDSGLVQGSDGYLYGTTPTGSATNWYYGSGTLFKINTNGALTVLYSFTGGKDGGNSIGGLVLGSDGNFYGTTSQGGNFETEYLSDGSPFYISFGTVFKISTNGTLTTLYAFGTITNADGNPLDGTGPRALVQGSDGNFYGTTDGGGANGNYYESYWSGDGTVFKISTNGTLTTLYSFTGSNDGGSYSGLVQGGDGYFYGTTAYNGVNVTAGGPDCLGNGTVFKISTNGALTTLYFFPGGNDDGDPYAGLVQGSDGNFYGTTSGGYYGSYGWGTVFKISPNGALTTLYSFTGGSDGFNPETGLMQGSDGNFYGTTYGDAFNFGTVFKISSNGALTTLYSFTGNYDGAHPNELVQGSDGNFYGSTPDGGTNYNGNVFKISANGGMSNLYSFNYGTNDTGGPWAALVQGTDGNFYGTTSESGPSSYYSGPSGTVFKISPNGALTTLYSFTGGNEGGQPTAPLVQGSDGNFYGTTDEGGTNGYGTVFKISTNGALTSLYSFTGGNDGVYPYAGLVQGTNGNFYGTTWQGGTNGYGTVFNISTNGALTTLYSFTGGNDGAYPYAGLAQGADGNFYGTTYEGGRGRAGTVFRVNVVLGPPIQYTANPTNGLVPLTVQFNAPSVDSLGNIISGWYWTFGDGSASTAQNPSHTYTTTGTFFPNLIAVNSPVSSFGPSITVSPRPIVQYTANPTNGPVPLIVQFNAAGVDSGGNTISRWNWTFGDGSASTSQNPSHTYTVPGNFSPSLIATNNIGLTVIGSGPASITATLVVNGGFETGDFTGWTLTGEAGDFNFVDDGSASGITPHSGRYVAALGQAGSLGYLSQTLATTAGAAYWLSLWLDSPDGQTPNEFLVSWNGNTLFDETNIPAIGWTNLQFLVSATATNMVLKFGFRDDPSYLGLDDISVMSAQPPGIASVSPSGTNLVLSGINGLSGPAYYVLTSTNLTLPFSQWTRVVTNVLSTSGNFTITVTNTVTRNVPQRFYILETQ